MRIIFNRKKLFLVLLLLPCFEIASQTSQPNAVSSYFDMSGFPQWTKDLRRGEIVAFGSFPFAYFFTSFFYDSYRYAANGWNARYAPWPLKPANAVEMTQSEQFAMLGISAGVAVSIALADYFIVLHQRNKQRQEPLIPAEPPVIIRRPLSEVIEVIDEIPADPGEIP